MDRTSALDHLPDTYRRLFAMLDEGHSPASISGALGVDESSVVNLVRIGTAKLESLTDPTTARSAR